jgi:mono/diheme cytochrome c family protein
MSKQGKPNEPPQIFPQHERIAMKKMPPSLLAVLLATLVLSACEKAPEPVSPKTPARVDTQVEEGPLDRNLDPVQVARGHAIYEKNCAECHGANGKGQPGDWRVRDAEGKYPPPPLDDSAHAWHHPTAVLMQAIREGSPQGEGNMPAWDGKLTEQEMQDVVAYIKSLWSDPVYRLWLKMEQSQQG